MLAYDPLSFGTPLQLLQIPAQAIRHVSDKVQDASCTLAHYTQDCKSMADVKASLGSLDAVCFTQASVDVGYICKKCHMVYPVRDACLTHQRMTCYASGGSGGKTMLKLEQLQFECRVCNDKFSTLSEVKAHCEQDGHKAKVVKASTMAAISPHPSSKPAYSSPSSAHASHSSSSTASSPYRANAGSPAAAVGATGDKDQYTPPTFVPIASTPTPTQKSPSAAATPSTPSSTPTNVTATVTAPSPSPPTPVTATPTAMKVDDSKDDADASQVE
jgi:AT-binding transcription factor 1